MTNTLADRDELIGQVINNLNIVLGSLGGQSEQFDKAVTSLSELVDGLAARKTDITAGWPTSTPPPAPSPICCPRPASR